MHKRCCENDTLERPAINMYLFFTCVFDGLGIAFIFCSFVLFWSISSIWQDVSACQHAINVMSAVEIIALW